MGRTHERKDARGFTPWLGHSHISAHTRIRLMHEYYPRGTPSGCEGQPFCMVLSASLSVPIRSGPELPFRQPFCLLLSSGWPSFGHENLWSPPYKTIRSLRVWMSLQVCCLL